MNPGYNCLLRLFGVDYDISDSEEDEQEQGQEEDGKYMSGHTRFPKMWHCDKCRLRRACAATC